MQSEKSKPQHLTYGVVSEGVFAESLRKFGGNSAESSRKLRFIAPGKGAEILRKVCGNFAEICGKFSAMTPSRTTPQVNCWKPAPNSGSRWAVYFQDKFDHDKGQKSAISGRRLHWRLSTGFFCFFSSIYVQFSKTSPLKSGESSEKSSGENRVKSCHVCGCHGFLSALIFWSILTDWCSVWWKLREGLLFEASHLT